LLAATTAGAVLFAVAVWVRPDADLFAGPAGAGFRTAAFGGSRSDGTYLGGELNLNRRGGLSDDPVATVPASSPRLWRAGTLDRYDGASWTATDLAAVSTVAPAGPNRWRLIPPTGWTPPTEPRGDRVEIVNGALLQVISAGQPLEVSARYLSGLAPEAGDRTSLPLDRVPEGFDVTYAPLPDADGAPDARLAAVPTAAVGADGRGSGYLQLPPGVPTRVTDLGARLVAGAPTRLAAVRAVEQAVRARMTYDLNSPVPRAGADAVDDALFVSHRGFCEHFAGAAAVLLRAGGIPARVAVGFSAGPPDGDRRTLRQADAHAWVEAWFPGVGWVTSDPTPPGALDRHWYDGLVSGLRSATAAVRRLFLVQGPWLPLVVIALVGAAVGAPTVVRFLRAGRRRPDSALDPALAAAFARLERSLRAAGAPRGPDETVAALAGRLDLPALLVLERALYGPVPPAPEASRAAAAQIEDAARSVHA
jgi:transglutaminase-like putative cysteine protease